MLIGMFEACLMYDLYWEESQVYGDSKIIKLLQTFTKLWHIESLGLKKGIAVTMALNVLINTAAFIGTPNEDFKIWNPVQQVCLLNDALQFAFI